MMDPQTATNLQPDIRLNLDDTQDRKSQLEQHAANPRSLRVYHSDLRYFLAWQLAHLKRSLPRDVLYSPAEVTSILLNAPDPAEQRDYHVDLITQFIIDHCARVADDANESRYQDVHLQKGFWRREDDKVLFAAPAEKSTEITLARMDWDVEKAMVYLLDVKKHRGVPSVATMTRRVAHLSKFYATEWGVMDNPVRHGTVQSAMKELARLADGQSGQVKRRALRVRDVQRLLAGINGRTHADYRDRALISLAFSTGGRRRSEMLTIRRDSIVEKRDPDTHLGIYDLGVKISKKRDQMSWHTLTARGTTALFLQEWLEILDRESPDPGPIFRCIDQRGRIGRPFTRGKSVYRVLRSRLEQVFGKADAAGFTPHSLRSGFVTEALEQQIPVPHIKGMTKHSSDQQVLSYGDEPDRNSNMARELLP